MPILIYKDMYDASFIGAQDVFVADFVSEDISLFYKGRCVDLNDDELASMLELMPKAAGLEFSQEVYNKASKKYKKIAESGYLVFEIKLKVVSVKKGDNQVGDIVTIKIAEDPFSMSSYYESLANYKKRQTYFGFLVSNVPAFTDAHYYSCRAYVDKLRPD